MISLNKNCYGCGICVSICPNNILQLKENSYGFLTPACQEPAACTQCKLCDSVCPLNQAMPQSTVLGSYAAWSKDPKVRLKASSGGIAHELGVFFLHAGGDVCGAIYDITRQRVIHKVAKNQEDLEEFSGSKYLQSNMADALKTLKSPGKHMVIGTPCQIAAIDAWSKKINRRDDFLLVDFFCHGVPSFLMWDKYLSFRQNKIRKPIKNIIWRNKRTGWHDSYNMTFLAENESFESRKSNRDLFYLSFLGNYCLNQVCYENCPYKRDNSCADIRIGDLWGNKYQKNKEGVSGILTFTVRGETVLHSMDRCFLEQELPEIIMEGQMKKPAIRPWGSFYFCTALRTSASLPWIAIPAYRFNQLMSLHKIIKRKIQKLSQRKS